MKTRTRIMTLCVVIVGLGISRHAWMSSLMYRWEHNSANGFRTCYLCGRPTVTHTDEIPYAVFIRVPTLKPESNRSTLQPLSVCEGCVTRYGWPLDTIKKEKMLANWKRLSIHYFVESGELPDNVRHNKTRQIVETVIFEGAP